MVLLHRLQLRPGRLSKGRRIMSDHQRHHSVVVLGRRSFHHWKQTMKRCLMTCAIFVYLDPCLVGHLVLVLVFMLVDDPVEPSETIRPRMVRLGPNVNAVTHSEYQVLRPISRYQTDLKSFRRRRGGSGSLVWLVLHGSWREESVSTSMIPHRPSEVIQDIVSCGGGCHPRFFDVSGSSGARKGILRKCTHPGSTRVRVVTVKAMTSVFVFVFDSLGRRHP